MFLWSSLLLSSLLLVGCDAEVKGTIGDADGNPISGAHVYLTGRLPPKDPHDEPRRVRIASPSMHNTASFSFAVPDEAGDLVLEIRHRDYAPVRRCFETTAELERRSPLRIVMKPGVTLRGTVCDRQGKLVKGARVVVQQRACETDASGRFCLEHLAKGEDMLVVEGVPDYKHKPALIRMTDDMPELRITLEPLFLVRPPPGGELLDLRGRVLCPDGTPPARTQVRVWYTGRHTVADPDGRFSIPSLEAKQYTLELYAFVKPDGPERNPWGGVVVRNVGPDTNDLEIRLPGLGAVRLRAVEKETGQPVECYGLFPYSPEPPGDHGPPEPDPLTSRKLPGGAVMHWSPVFALEWRMTRHPRGEATVRGLLPGKYHIAVRAQGFIQCRLPPAVVEAGTTTHLGTVALERGLIIRGRVVGPSGTPLEGARVSALGTKAGVRPPMFSEVNYRLSYGAVTDGNGRFALEGVETLDSWRLCIEATGYWPADHEFGRLQAPTDMGTLKIPEGKRISLVTASGTVYDERGKPVPAVRLYFSGHTTTEPQRGYSDVVYSDLRGRYSARLAADGEYRVSLEREVWKALGRFAHVREEASLKVRDRDVTKDFSITLGEWRGFEE